MRTSFQGRRDLTHACKSWWTDWPWRLSSTESIDPSPLEEAIAGELEPAQVEAFAEHLVAEFRWWRDVVGTLHRNAQLSEALADEPAGQTEPGLKASNKSEEQPDIEPKATKKENTRGRPNELIEE